MNIYFSAILRNLVMLLCSVSIGTALYAQCTAPTSIGTLSVIHASCPGSGQITIDSMTPSATSIAPDYYQYALYDTFGTTVIKPYQSSNVLIDIDAGVYDLYVRKVCTTGFSTPITYRVTVNNTEQSPFITSIVLNRASQCSNGRFTVNATGSAPLQYALVDSISAPDPPASYVRDPQVSNIFDSLEAGTYYVRVYNACGNAVTQAMEVPEKTSVSSVSSPDFFPLGCDDVRFSFITNNYINISNTIDTAMARAWIKWPSGLTDSIVMSTTVSTGATIPRHSVITHLSNIDPAYDPTETWYGNLSNFPYAIHYGFRDICGNIFLDSFTLYEPTQKQLIMSVTESHDLTTCDSVAYRFRIQSSRPGLTPNQLIYHGYRSLDSFLYSADSGITWTNARSSNAISTTGSSYYSDYIPFPRGVETELRVAYCGDTLTHTFTPVAQPALNATASNNTIRSCIGYGGISTAKQNAVGDSLGYEMLAAPAEQPIIPYFTHFVGTLSATSVYYLPQYQNLIPGAYTIRIWDTFGVECPRYIDRSITVTPYDLDFDFEGMCNGSLRVYETTTPQLSYLYMRVRILDELGNTVLGPYTGSSSAPNTTIVPADDIADLPDGNYTVRVYKSVALNPYLDTCTIVDKPWIKQPNLLNLTPSKFVPGCPGGTGAIVAMAQGGKPPYSFQLSDASSIVVPPTVPGGNIFDNLAASETYTLQVIDSCGTVVNRTMSVGEDLAVFIRDFSSMPCPDDDVTLFVDSMPNVNYQWYKNGLAVAGEMGHELFLPTISNADSGEYEVEVEIGSCVVLINSFMLDPGDCGAPLPVTLLSFDVLKNGNAAELVWTTASEQNNKGFNIERSTDGNSWETIGYIPSRAEGGNSTFTLDYAYTDHAPVAGRNLYRLKQTDFDGRYAYSLIRTIWFELESKINIYPNPAQTYIEISGLAGNETINMYDITGRLIKEQKSSGSGMHIAIGDLNEGVYYISVTDDRGSVFSAKVVKIK